MRSAVIGMGSLFVVVFVAMAMGVLARSAIVYQETNAACNEAIYQTEIFLNEENDAVSSNEDLKQVFLSFLRPALTNPGDYTVNFYGVDYKNGLLDIGVRNDNYGNGKLCEARRTMIVDEEE